MSESSFWNDRENSDKVISKIKELKGLVSDFENLIEDIDYLKQLLSLYDYDSVESVELFNEFKHISDKFRILETKLLLNGEYDSLDCILEIHPGAGGTESCDWALMLFRMYLRWCDIHNFKYEIVDYQDGEEAGIKSVCILIKGFNSYGLLKNEKGVHRLIRLSPFDSNNRRHTSFASVDVTPNFEKVEDVIINENDLKIDVYRSSGAGGQHVNTTDSAVRITHLPTKIVVTCQSGRSQIQNKEKAMNMLKNKLKVLMKQQEASKMNEIKGEMENINFGSQIRSYIMHPYSLVKDHRTNTETSNVLKVLDGEIDLFIDSNLRRNVC